MIDIYVNVRELAPSVGVCRTKLFALMKQGHLSKPRKWCGKKLAMYSLRIACNEIAIYNNVEMPSDETIKLLGWKIVELRLKRTAK